VTESIAVRAPVGVRVAGRWHQGLAAIVVMMGLAASEFAVVRARASAGALLEVMGAFVLLAVLLFVTGSALVRGRRWGWWLGVIVCGTLLVLLVYAVSAAPQPATQRWTATFVTSVLFGVPVILLGLPSTRRFFATREA
jgi:hypothetical protein